MNQKVFIETTIISFSHGIVVTLPMRRFEAEWRQFAEKQATKSQLSAHLLN